MSSSVGVLLSCYGCNNSERVYLNPDQIDKLIRGLGSVSSKRFIIHSQGNPDQISCLECGESFTKWLGLSNTEVDEVDQLEQLPIYQRFTDVDNLGSGGGRHIKSFNQFDYSHMKYSYNGSTISVTAVYRINEGMTIYILNHVELISDQHIIAHMTSEEFSQYIELIGYDNYHRGMRDKVSEIQVVLGLDI